MNARRSRRSEVVGVQPSTVGMNPEKARIPAGGGPVGAEPERVAHHRAHREAAEDRLLRGQSGALPEGIVEVRERRVGGSESVRIRISDPRHRVPVTTGPARHGERASGGDHVEPAGGVERVGEPDQVVLVGAPAVVQDEQPLGSAGGGSFVEVEAHHTTIAAPTGRRQLPGRLRGPCSGRALGRVHTDRRQHRLAGEAGEAQALRTMSFSLGSMIELVRGDITRQHVDVIVNAANSDLAHGAGVAAAIAVAAGPDLRRESEAHSVVPVGAAAVTTAGDLPARWVVHAVGPIWSGGDAREPELLDSAYRSALAVASRPGRQLDRLSVDLDGRLRLSGRRCGGDRRRSAERRGGGAGSSGADPDLPVQRRRPRDLRGRSRRGRRAIAAGSGHG